MCYILHHEVSPLIYAKIKVTLAKAQEILAFYGAEEIDDPSKPYDFFQCRKGKVDIHCYRNRKEIYTVVFSGSEEAIDEARLFSEDVTVTRSEEKSGKKERTPGDSWDDLSTQVGSDEVGVGDFFGPLLVVASYVTPKDIPFLQSVGVDDSKKMTDDAILAIGDLLRRKCACYSVLVSPDKLSRLVDQGMNIHKVMAKCHNLAQEGVMKRYDVDEETIVYVDQFEEESLYRKHVGRDIVKNPLYFRTRGETYFPSVALSSVIARYLFLKEWEKMEAELGTKIPKGASASVDHVYNLLVKEQGIEKVSFHVKKFFRNYKNN